MSYITLLTLKQPVTPQPEQAQPCGNTWPSDNEEGGSEVIIFARLKYRVPVTAKDVQYAVITLCKQTLKVITCTFLREDKELS